MALRQIKNLLETSPLVSSTFDTVASTRPYRLFNRLFINHHLRRLQQSKKYHCVIETTNRCNARCRMCPHSQMKRPQKTMTDATFTLILDRLKKEAIQPPVFILNGFGDPLADDKIIARIKQVKVAFPDSIIKIYTNLSLTNPTRTRQLLTSGINEINVSFNGYNQRDYQETMGLNYRCSLKNLHTLLKTRRRLHSPVKIRLSMALVSQNERHISQFIRRWQPQVDSVSVNRVHSYAGSVKISSDNFSINFDKTPYPCKYIFDTLVFTLDGHLSLCCLDYEAAHTFGNIKNNSILQMFNSPAFNKIRSLHLQYQADKIPICSRCYTPYKNGIEWFIDKLY